MADELYHPDKYLIRRSFGSDEWVQCSRKSWEIINKLAHQFDGTISVNDHAVVRIEDPRKYVVLEVDDGWAYLYREFRGKPILQTTTNNDNWRVRVEAWCEERHLIIAHEVKS